MNNLPGTRFTQSVVYLDQVPSNQVPNQANQQPQYTDEQIYKMVDNAFQQFDKNKTGELDSQQLKNFLQYAVKIGLLQPSKKSLFIQYIYKIDTNRDGLVSKDELYQFFSKKTSGRLNQPMLMINSKPMLDKQKVKKLPFQQRQYSDNEISQLVELAFTRYDLNGTGQLDYYETKQYLKRQWNNAFNYHEVIQIADKNNNGLVSRDQLYKFLRAKLL